MMLQPKTEKPGVRMPGRVEDNIQFLGKRIRRRSARVPRLSLFGLSAHHYLVLSVVLVVAASLLFDAASVSWASGLPSPIRHFFRFLTRYGKSDWILYPSGIFCLVLAAADWKVVSRRIAAAWFEAGAIAAFLFLSVAGAGIVTNIAKQIIGRSRPRLFETEGAYSLVPFTFDYSHQGFPSGHATTAGALFMVVAVVAPRYRAAAAVFAGLILISRVVVGAHYPSDVVAGFLFGAAFALLVARALASRGFGFSAGSKATITAPGSAIRYAFGRSGGVGIMIGSLVEALAGHRNRPTTG
jgi:undecaprenyl-diphosphatase